LITRAEVEGGLVALLIAVGIIIIVSTGLLAMMFFAASREGIRGWSALLRASSM